MNQPYHLCSNSKSEKSCGFPANYFCKKCKTRFCYLTIIELYMVINEYDEIIYGCTHDRCFECKKSKYIAQLEQCANCFKSKLCEDCGSECGTTEMYDSSDSSYGKFCLSGGSICDDCHKIGKIFCKECYEYYQCDKCNIKSNPTSKLYVTVCCKGFYCEGCKKTLKRYRDGTIGEYDVICDICNNYTGIRNEPLLQCPYCKKWICSHCFDQSLKFV